MQVNAFILYSTSTLYEKGGRERRRRRERKEEDVGERGRREERGGNEKEDELTQLTLSVTRCVQL